MQYFLGIESSCDECSASVVRVDTQNGMTHWNVLSLCTFSQVEIHAPFGGVVPEIASRSHLEQINDVIEKAISDSGISVKEMTAICVTNRPGLIGALLVGVSAAKALAYAYHKPLIGVHHLEGHAMSVYLDQPDATELEYPLIMAVVSGGHSNYYLSKTPPMLWKEDFLQNNLIGKSIDDAAGEAFDKTAKLMGFPYPGGSWLDRYAREKNGNPNAFSFPRALMKRGLYDFSFSGLKTAVALEIEKQKKAGKFDENLADLCASTQEAIVEAIVKKLSWAIQDYGARSLTLVGGVSANSRLRIQLENIWEKLGIEGQTYFPKMKYCTDNAAMIAAAGAVRYFQGKFLKGDDRLTLNAKAANT